MRRVHHLALLLLVATCTSCATTDVRVEFDPQEDFSRYHTWEWLPLRPSPGMAGRLGDPELDALVRASVERELGDRGYRRVLEHRPDFYVTYHVAIVREIKVHTESPASQTLLSHHQTPSYTVSGSQQSVRIYETGTLAVDVADGRERQLVWRGIGERRVRQSFKRQVDETVAAIVERFPPGADPGLGEDED